LNSKKNYDVFNICSSKPIKIIKIIDRLKKLTNYHNIKNISMNKHEVYKTYGSNKKILKKVKIKNVFVPINIGVNKTFDWFKKYKNLL
jgi:UDP-glucuronate 4-epimerase